MTKKKLNITLIGSGHAALALGLALKKKHVIAEIAARNQKKASVIAKKIGCRVVALTNYSRKSDVYILCVSDDAIATVAKKLKVNGTVIHLSGATPLNVLKQKNAAAAWPIRSLAGVLPTDWKNIHVLYETSGKQAASHVKKLFGSLGAKLHNSNSQQRAAGHVSVVILNNFIHHLAFKGKELLKMNKLHPHLYQQVISDVTKKLLSEDLFNTQTGPARRNDKTVLRKQEIFLQHDPNLQKIYKAITKSILNTYSHE